MCRCLFADTSGQSYHIATVCVQFTRLWNIIRPIKTKDYTFSPLRLLKTNLVMQPINRQSNPEHNMVEQAITCIGLPKGMSYNICKMY